MTIAKKHAQQYMQNGEVSLEQVIQAAIDEAIAAYVNYPEYRDKNELQERIRQLEPDSLMADCMIQTRLDLIASGFMPESVAPMFVSDFVISKMRQLEQERVPEFRLDDEVRWILGRPNFACGGIARDLRRLGNEIATKSEDEQAFVIHWMLTMYRQHGKDWRAKGDAMLAAAPAQEKV